MTTLIEVLGALRTKMGQLHIAVETGEAYCHWVGRYFNFCHERNPVVEEPSDAAAETFLRHFVPTPVCVEALSALRFYHQEVLGKPLGDVRIGAAIGDTVVTPEEFERFRSAAPDSGDPPVRLLADLMYERGLRVGELVDLRTRDVLWSEGMLTIRGQKGGSDRQVSIPVRCAEPLRRQLDHARAFWTKDGCHRPKITVPLLWREARRYPRAASSWRWYWVFPAASHYRDPLTHENSRFHFLVSDVQSAFHEVASTAGLARRITPPDLRRAFLSRGLREAGATPLGGISQ